MNQSSPLIRLGAIPLLLLAGCGEGETRLPAPEPPRAADSRPPAGPDPGSPAAGGPAAPGEPGSSVERQVIEEVFRATAQQQAEGLGGGRVRVNGAWPYTGYSHLAPDPAAAIEARLVAVDLTVAGHTPRFDFDDIEIVDGATLVSYGSDAHITPLRDDGTPRPEEEPIPVAPAASRWLLIYAFPKASDKFRLYYWGRDLTPSPVGFSASGLSLPFPDPG